MSAQPELVPNDAKIWFYCQLKKYYERVLPKVVRDFLSMLIIKVSPNIPVDLTTCYRETNIRLSFWGGFAGTFLVCFCAIILLCLKYGTLFGTDANRIYFLYDLPNIVNYALLCPLYVGLSCALIAIYIRGTAELKQFACEIQGVPRKQFLPGLALPFYLFLVVLAAAGITTNYVQETLNPHVYQRVYWFIEKLSTSGERILGSIGIYYILLNFTLLCISIVTFTIALAVFVQATDVGYSLGTCDKPYGLDAFKTRLKSFTQAYLVVKWLTAIYMINFTTWVWGKPMKSFNIVLLGLVLSFFGVVFISVPRYYLELQWYRYKNRLKINNPEYYDDIRTPMVLRIVYILDVVIIGGFVTSALNNLINLWK